MNNLKFKTGDIIQGEGERLKILFVGQSSYFVEVVVPNLDIDLDDIGHEKVIGYIYAEKRYSKVGKTKGEEAKEEVCNIEKERDEYKMALKKALVVATASICGHLNPDIIKMKNVIHQALWRRIGEDLKEDE